MVTTKEKRKGEGGRGGREEGKEGERGRYRSDLLLVVSSRVVRVAPGFLSFLLEKKKRKEKGGRGSGGRRGGERGREGVTVAPTTTSQPPAA